MPRIKRWFPTNQDINGDHELWYFTDTFGDRALRLWLEVLSILERSENGWRLTGGWLAGLSRRVRQTPANCSRQLRHCLAAGWLIGHGQSADGWPEVLSASKYAEYHRTRETNKQDVGKRDGSLPSESSESSYSSNTILLRKSISESRNNGFSDWPQSDAWLAALLKKQDFLAYGLEHLSDLKWWNAVAEDLNGMDEGMMQKELAKMSAWFLENPSRKPTAKGLKRFLRTWLERSEERERRLRK